VILFLDTSTPICKLTLIDGDWSQAAEWEAGRELAKGLLAFLQTELKRHDKTWQDIDGIGVFTGPGSFTGLRIGITVLNTLADTLAIAIVGCSGEDWQIRTRDRLLAGENEKMILPFYGSEANVTKPRK